MRSSPISRSSVVFVNVSDALVLHDYAIRRFGGEPGVRDLAYLDSAILGAQTGYYDSLCEIAAAYTWAITNNHPFFDGNKRVGLAVGAAFLGANGRRMKAERPYWYRTMLEVAQWRKFGMSRSKLRLRFARAIGGDVRVVS